MKKNHENIWRDRNYSISDPVVERIIWEENRFFSEIETDNNRWIGQFDLAFPLNLREKPSDHLDDMIGPLDNIEQLLDSANDRFGTLADDIANFLDSIGVDSSQFREVSYYNNPFFNIDWEFYNIGVPNWFAEIKKISPFFS